MPTPASHRASAELRKRILSTALKPGERLREDELARELGVSRTPVHEAVQRLAGEGLVEVRPRAGTFVARFDAARLQASLFVVRALVAALAEQAALKWTGGDATLRSVLSALAEAVQAGDVAAFFAAENALLAELAAAAGQSDVLPVLDRAKVQLDRLRHVVLVRSSMHEAALLLDQLPRALDTRNPTRVALALHRHLDLIEPMVAMTRALQPAYFG
ncbi:MAG: GntR family transcriptional regulator [Telluria sp.]